MRMFCRLLILIVLIFAAASFADGNEAEVNNSELSFSCAWFDFIQRRNQAFELAFEYRSPEYIWKFRPFIAMMTTEKGTAASFAGLLTDIVLFSNVYFTPSFAPGIYYSGKGKEMYYGLEFRSQLELTYKLKTFRLGINLSHISNGRLYHINPGVESIAFNLVVPLK